MRLLGFGLLLSFAVPAPGQPAKQIAQDAAVTPVEDVNLKKREISPVLLSAEQDPYSSEATRNCAQINAALDSLNGVLGPDFDSDKVAKKGLNKTGIAKNLVGSFIPFRGVVREVSGAAGAERRYNAAVDAGIARRGYLRGVAVSRGCKPSVTSKEAAAN